MSTVPHHKNAPYCPVCRIYWCYICNTAPDERVIDWSGWYGKWLLDGTIPPDKERYFKCFRCGTMFCLEYLNWYVKENGWIVPKHRVLGKSFSDLVSDEVSKSAKKIIGRRK